MYPYIFYKLAYNISIKMLSLNTVNLHLRFVCTCNTFRPLNKTVIKNLSSKSNTSVKNTNQGKKIDVKLGKYDYVGPPHEKANIRPFIFYCHERETRLETLYRQNREETQDWNITFWSHHNIKFEKVNLFNFFCNIKC
ncbi:Apoptogenic protein 1, mitochondrial [Armadillidium vulgare]|nr:Apoptogenic protein 1, mitochondrial [Armadillidium vulgare]